VDKAIVERLQVIMQRHALSPEKISAQTGLSATTVRRAIRFEPVWRATVDALVKFCERFPENSQK
jgi:hypothetical protein